MINSAVCLFIKPHHVRGSRPNIFAQNNLDNTMTALHALDRLTQLPKSTLTGKPVLHFVHANGFPSLTYQPLFAVWEQVFTVEFIALFGTDFNYPPDNHWQSLTHQVLDNIDKICKKHGVPHVVAVGHSVGAVTTLQACAIDPTHISQIIALDPSLLMGKNSFIAQCAKIADRALHRLPKFQHHFMDKISPAGKSKHRKETFDSRETAYDSLRPKGLFKAFDENIFKLYIEHGFSPKEGKVSLTIPKAIEVAIFRTMPSLYWVKSLTLFRPTTLIAGQDSYFTHIGSYHKVADKWGMNVIYTSGTHMFPLEHPDEVSKLVLEIINQQIKPHTIKH